MPGLYKSVGGDFDGGCDIKIGALWTGPKADKFKGIVTHQPKQRYEPDDIVLVTELRPEQIKTLGSSAIAAGAGALLFGGAGFLLGAIAGGKKDRQFVGVEFSDGKKLAFMVKPKDKMYQCLKLYASERQIINYGF